MSDMTARACYRSKGPDYTCPEWERISSEGKALVKSLLNRDAGLRPSACSALTHPWIRTRGRKSNGKSVTLDAAVLSALQVVPCPLPGCPQ
eukprot:4431795-Pyramimonas_sp.AAC.2